jgi:phosphate transport system substrate-binding protein
MRGIYSGAITDWQQLGDGSVSGKIDAYQRPEGSGSQSALLNFMGGVPLMPPKMEQINDMMAGTYERISDYTNYKNALGYSFRFYIQSMLNNNQLKQVRLLSIDGVEPTEENITNGTYPFGGAFYAVTVDNREHADEASRERMANAEAFIEWMQSEQGQELVEKTGYVKI